MREPDLTGDGGRKAWCVPPPSPEVLATVGPDCSVARWVVEFPGAHAIWSFWFVYVVHLRATSGVPAAKLHYPEATHEFGILSLDPEHYPPSVDGKGPYHFLEPHDCCVQFHGVDDVGAGKLAHSAVRLIMAGQISPDSDFRSVWESLVQQTADCIASGKHPTS